MKSINNLLRRTTKQQATTAALARNSNQWMMIKKNYSVSSSSNHADRSVASFTIQPLTKENLKETVMLTAMTFGKHEPIMGNKFQPTDLFHFARVLATRAAEENLGHVAVDKSGMIVGAVFSCDHVKSIFENAFSSIDFYPEGLQLMEDLHHQYFEKIAANPKHEQFHNHSQEKMFTPQNVGKILHFLVGVTAEFYQGNGVMSQLSKFHLKHCKELGYEQAFAECSSVYSTKALEKCGFHTEHSIQYANYEKLNDKQQLIKPFENVPLPHKSMNLVWNYHL